MQSTGPWDKDGMNHSVAFSSIFRGKDQESRSQWPAAQKSVEIRYVEPKYRMATSRIRSEDDFEPPECRTLRKVKFTCRGCTSEKGQCTMSSHIGWRQRLIHLQAHTSTTVIVLCSETREIRPKYENLQTLVLWQVNRLELCLPLLPTD
jgi:hypothetical protein